MLDKQRVDIESIYRNVGAVWIPYLLVKNFNSKSKLVIDARQTQSFAVKKNNFENIVNMVYANRYIAQIQLNISKVIGMM